MDATCIFAPSEFRAVLDDLKRRAKYPNARIQLTLFRLSFCCGLRCCEMCGLNMSDVTTGGLRPCIHIRKEITKGRSGKRKERIVELWHDAGTLADLQAWEAERLANGAGPNDPFLCGTTGKRLVRQLCFNRWRTAIQILGPARVRQLSVHKGRHNFVSYSLWGGRTLPAVRDQAGHADISTTNGYLHVLPSDDVPNDIFDRHRPCPSQPALSASPTPTSRTSQAGRKSALDVTCRTAG